MAAAKPVIYTICYIFAVNTYFFSPVKYNFMVSEDGELIPIVCFQIGNSFHSQIPQWQINLYLRCDITSIICSKLHIISKHVTIIWCFINQWHACTYATILPTFHRIFQPWFETCIPHWWVTRFAIASKCFPNVPFEIHLYLSWFGAIFKWRLSNHSLLLAN